ncbi:MAG TPA: hypothetical protein PLP88_00790, partial [Bacteroidales bacterium]|nr:hypothetical protein [Bacteroidales bacterium]
MKTKWIVVAVIAMVIAVIAPSGLNAQNQNADKAKNKKTENPGKPDKKVVTITPGNVPPGQEGKAVNDDKVKGYEKTGDTGKKEGWSKQGQSP